MNTTSQLPEILTANTYFWKPGTSASSRRRNEERRLGEVADYFTSVGFEVEVGNERVIAKKSDLEVIFYYSESTRNVYKKLAVLKNGKVSNITSLKKIL